MPKDKYPNEHETSSKKPLFPHNFFSEEITRYGTFGFTDGQNEYGHVKPENEYSVYNDWKIRGIFVFNEAGCELIARAFPGFSLKEILEILNKEFEDPLAKGYSHGMLLCKFVGDNINSIEIHSERGFWPITGSTEYHQEAHKAYASDIGKNIVDKLFEDLVPYLQRKTDENAHLVKRTAPKPKNDL